MKEKYFLGVASAQEFWEKCWVFVMVTVTSVMPVIAAAEVAVPNPEGLVAEVQRDGARAVVTRLWADEALFDAILVQIESGDAAWLEVARHLRPGSDAGSSESLNYAVALALPRAPSRVLPMIGKGFQLAFVCTAPHTDANLSVVMGHLRSVEKALKNFKTNKHAVVKAECLASVRSRMKELRSIDVPKEPQPL
ncbi:MAG: hypothetical protein ACK4F6_15135 [Hylemonella sp.]